MEMRRMTARNGESLTFSAMGLGTGPLEAGVDPHLLVKVENRAPATRLRPSNRKAIASARARGSAGVAHPHKMSHRP